MTNSETKSVKNRLPYIIVIGTSAGGLKALVKLVSQLDSTFSAPLLVVQHISAEATGSVLLNALIKNSNLTCAHAVNGKKARSGHLYLAPADRHLMIDENSIMLVTKGAQENRYRPAIDPLFRSAAVAFGNRVIGVLLTGYLDDGTAGLKAIKRCGGISVVQDPADADYPDMPTNALHQVEVDYCLPLSGMGELLNMLISKKPGKRKPVPKDILIETEIAKRVISDLTSVNSLGEQVPFNCPGCGGVLWKVAHGSSMRYRCHTGHTYTAVSLLAEQAKKIEETMWTALRMFEERKNLLITMAKVNKGATAESASERAKLFQVHINRIRLMLQADDKGTAADLRKNQN